jgi:endo-1,4-beta-xylanase
VGCQAHDPTYANLLDLRKLVVTGYSRWGKAALLAGMLDERFQLTAPGGSGSGGATPYRYDSYGKGDAIGFEGAKPL